jgi:hypothetical protein
MSAVVSRGRVANGKRVHVSGAAAAPARRVAGLSPRAFFLPITHLRHFLIIHVSGSHMSALHSDDHALFGQAIKSLKVRFEKHD